MAKTIRDQPVAELIETLAERVREIEGTRRTSARGVVSSGHAALDRALPERGLRRGSLVEWLSGGTGSGAAWLALLAAREAVREGGALVVVDRERRFYPPAAARVGIELARMIVVRPQSDADHAWALDQTLRSPGVAAVWCWSGEQDDHTLRRWQLAAESSGVLGLLLRGAAARHEPSWAELRLAVEPLVAEDPSSIRRDRRLRVELLRCRGGHAGGIVELEWSGMGGIPDRQALRASRRGTCYETRTVHLDSPLAVAKTRRRSRRA